MLREGLRLPQSFFRRAGSSELRRFKSTRVGLATVHSREKTLNEAWWQDSEVRWDRRGGRKGHGRRRRRCGRRRRRRLSKKTTRLDQESVG